MGKIFPVCTINPFQPSDAITGLERVKAPRRVEVYLHSHPHQWLEVSGHLHSLMALPLGKRHPLHWLIEYEALWPQRQSGWFGVQKNCLPLTKIDPQFLGH
jgi:hypothetical protein